MNFDLNADQLLLEETLDRMLAKKFDLGWVRTVFDGPSGRPEALWSALAELGLFGVMIPEMAGGSGLGLLDLVVASETLGYHAAPGPFLEHVVAAVAIDRLGSDEQRRRWLPGLADGSLRATVALGDPGQRWMPSAWSMGGARLTGRKTGVLYPADADVVVVGTREGMGLVDGDAPGLSVTEDEPLDRTRRCVTVDLDDVAIDYLPGGNVDEVMDVALVLLAADAAGGARRCLDMTSDYAKTREQFGVSIGSFQAVKHQLADMAVDVLPLRYLVWYAAHSWDNSLPEASKLAAMAKARTTDQYMAAARRSVEIHGGIGYTWECDVQFFLKRAVFDRTYLGAPSVHYRRVAHMNGWGRPESPLEGLRA